MDVYVTNDAAANAWYYVNNGDGTFTRNDTIVVGQGHGVNIIEKVLGGCVIKENFSVADSSFVGKSWSVYDPQTGNWQQTWVDNKGGYLLFTGKFKDGKMILQTDPLQRQGKVLIYRMTFESITENSFDWIGGVRPMAARPGWIYGLFATCAKGSALRQIGLI